MENSGVKKKSFLKVQSFLQIYKLQNDHMKLTVIMFVCMKYKSDPNCVSASGKGLRTVRQDGGMQVAGVVREEQACRLDRIPNRVVLEKLTQAQFLTQQH